MLSTRKASVAFHLYCTLVCTYNIVKWVVSVFLSPLESISPCWRRRSTDNTCFLERSNLASFAKSRVEKSSNPSPKATGAVGMLSSRHLYIFALLLVAYFSGHLWRSSWPYSPQDWASLLKLRETNVCWLESTSDFLSGVPWRPLGLCSPARRVQVHAFSCSHLSSVSHVHEKKTQLVWTSKGGVTVIISRPDIGLCSHVEALAQVRSRLLLCMLLAACKRC